jgi:EAL domain-containing protein (putative c-di-GMP-specific phosphodiesterase class I)
VLLSEYIHIDQALEDLNKLGVVIAMDDFGTGYSSLSYLRNYPFGVIKIDRSFIQDIDRNSMSLKLNHAAIAMAHALNIRVVAEGVETRSQFSILQGLKCDVAQGYYFGRPISAEQFTELLRAQVRETRSDAVIDIAERTEFHAKKPLPRDK